MKLGTITKDPDTADCYCYAADEDGPVKIPNLPELLAKRGINVTMLNKTEKVSCQGRNERGSEEEMEATVNAYANISCAIKRGD